MPVSGHSFDASNRRDPWLDAGWRDGRRSEDTRFLVLCAGDAGKGFTVVAIAVGELKHTVMRVVSTLNTEVDRRMCNKGQIRLRCRLTIAGQGVFNGRTVDLSEQGARIANVPSLSVGTQGTLNVDGVKASLTFTVRNQYSNALGLIFDADAATAIRAALDSLVQQAA